ncbi:MAG: hypothetical protein RIS47_163 [Bacteroidota bacterium]
MSYQSHELQNGIRLVFAPAQSLISHCGIFLNTGSRDEMPHQLGMAHFIEHTIFKGTKKRKAYHILSRLDDVGGELNAYTTKEETVVHASFLNEYLDRSLELIADIVFCSTFPEKEIEKEKEVIIDEINSYKDSPSEQIFDDFDEKLFRNDPLGRQILGTEASIRSFTGTDVQAFIAENYHTDQMVVSVVGNQDFAKVLRMFERYFGQIPENRRVVNKRKLPQAFQFDEQVECGTHQTHCILGCPAYDMNSKYKTSFTLLNNLLGGSGLNARLSLSLREKHGITYNIESSYQNYSDMGIFTVYFGTDKENVAKSLELIYREIVLLRDKPLGTMQLLKAKKQLIGQIAMGMDSNENQMITNGKSLLYYGKIDTLEAVYANIDGISADDLLFVAQEIFDPKAFSKLFFL